MPDKRELPWIFLLMVAFGWMYSIFFEKRVDPCIDHASKTIHVLINKGISDAPVDPDAVIKEVCK